MGKERVAPPGYYLCYLGTPGKPRWEYTTVEFVPDDLMTATCQYTRGDAGMNWDRWTMLLWTCAPTKKQLAKSDLKPEDTSRERYMHFDTFVDLLAYVPFEIVTPPWE